MADITISAQINGVTYSGINTITVAGLTIDLSAEGGGGGGLPLDGAVLHVNAPLGSTVTFSKGGVTVKTIGPENAHANADGETADYYCSVSSSNFGSWTITASLNGTSASSTVTVNSAEQYDIEVFSRLSLFTNGTGTNTDTTGGWTHNTGTKTDAASSVGIMRSVSGESHDNWHMYLRTVNTIDLTGWNTLHFDITDCNGGTYYAPNIFVGTNGNPSALSNTSAYTSFNAAGAVTLDVSSLSGAYYVGFIWAFQVYGTYDLKAYANNIWLSK